MSATDDGLILLDDKQIAKLSETQKISILTTRGDDQLTIDESLRQVHQRPRGHRRSFSSSTWAKATTSSSGSGSPGDDSFKLTADGIDVARRRRFRGQDARRRAAQLRSRRRQRHIRRRHLAAEDRASTAARERTVSSAAWDRTSSSSRPVATPSTAAKASTWSRSQPTRRCSRSPTRRSSWSTRTTSSNTRRWRRSSTVGGARDSKLEINGFHFDKFDFDGGGGLDEIKLTTGLPAVQLTGDKISLLDADQKLVGEIKYAGFDTFSYLGDETASKIELDDTIKFAKLDLDGGGGGDQIKLTSDDTSDRDHRHRDQPQLRQDRDRLQGVHRAQPDRRGAPTASSRSTGSISTSSISMVAAVSTRSS